MAWHGMGTRNEYKITNEHSFCADASQTDKPGRAIRSPLSKICNHDSFLGPNNHFFGVWWFSLNVIGRADIRTETPPYRDASSHLKRKKYELVEINVKFVTLQFSEIN